MAHTIVIVDDHTLIAEALAGIINTFRDYQVLYEVENGKAMIEKFSHAKSIPDIVLLDINMPVMNGYDTAKWLTQHHPDVRILALSMQDQEETLIKMIRCGASGYLLKNIHPQDLEQALNTIIQKGYYYPDWVTHKLVMNLSPGTTKNHVRDLNDREKNFLKYAATEMTYKEIADVMNCSARTVEGYRDNLFEKFGAKSRVGLVIYALKHGIIEL